MRNSSCTSNEPSSVLASWLINITDVLWYKDRQNELHAVMHNLCVACLIFPSTYNECQNGRDETKKREYPVKELNQISFGQISGAPLDNFGLFAKLAQAQQHNKF